MVLRGLNPAPKESLDQGWEILASEAGRSKGGICATISLLNGEPKDMLQISAGDTAGRDTAAARFAALCGLDQATIAAALVKLMLAAEALLRQITDAGAPSQATRMVELASAANAELFHSPGNDSEAYASIKVGGHQETWLLKTRGFRRWLARQFYEAEEKAPGSQAIQDALTVLEGKALNDGPEYPVYRRLAEHAGNIYLDLADKTWRCVEIAAAGWRIIDTAPIKFCRAKGALPLPIPISGGTLNDLRPFVNIKDDADWVLLTAWLIAALRPTGSYPVLTFHGEQGAAKSTHTRVVRGMVDPNEAMLRSSPGEERDLIIAATNGWVIALDNMSHLPVWLSDAICRLATGAGFATRQLYTDAEEAIFKAQRPVLMNGIEELATRGDLLDRAILLYLPDIPDHKRKTEALFRSEFEAQRPLILGALLDIVSDALSRLPHVSVPKLPRMADFAMWACAASEAAGWEVQTPEGDLLFGQDAFLHAYTGNRESANELTLEASPIVEPIKKIDMPWDGTARNLLDKLCALVNEKEIKRKTWPKSPRALSNILRRITPNLRAIKIGVEFYRESGSGQRMIRLEAL